MAGSIVQNTGSVIVEPTDTALVATVVAGIEIGSTIGPVATVIFPGDSAITPANPSVGPGVLIDAEISGQTTAEQSVLEDQGIFVNAGTIAADGPAGSTFSVLIGPSGLIGGSFLNVGTITSLVGNTMSIAASGSPAAFIDQGSIIVSGSLAVATSFAESGNLLVQSGGQVSDSGLVTVDQTGDSTGGLVTVTGTGTKLGVGTLAVADVAPGSVLVQSGARLVTGELEVGGSLLGPFTEASNPFTLRGTVTASGGGDIQATPGLAIWAGSTLSVDATSAVDVGNSGLFLAGEVFVESGKVLAGDGLIHANVVNNGTVFVGEDAATGANPGPGTLEITGSLTGNIGIVEIGANGILKLDNTTTQTIQFQPGGAGELILPNPGTYTMPLLGLNTGDKIEIAGAASITGVSISGSTITIATGAGNTVLTDVSFAPGANKAASYFADSTTGDQAIQISQLIDNWTGASGTNLGTAANWSAGVPTSADGLNFDVGVPENLTGTANGLTANFGGAGWGLQGATLTLAGQPAPPFDPFALYFAADVTLNGATVVAGGTSSFGSNIQGVTVTAQGGSTVTTAGDSIALNAGEFASLLLSGAGTTWTESANPADAGNGFNSGFLRVGDLGVGFLTVTSAATLTTGAYSAVGDAAASFGGATVTAGGAWTTAGLIVGENAGSEGEFIVSGGTVSDSQDLLISQYGDGQATITAGGTLAFGGTFAAVGDQPGSSGQLVIGAGGTLLGTATPLTTNDSYYLDIGDYAATSTLPAADGSVIVNGAGALLNTNDNSVSIGVNGGNGALTVSNGGTALVGSINNDNLAGLAVGRLGDGLVDVTGTGSELAVEGGMFVGRGGTGDLVVASGGFLDVTPDPNGLGGLGIGQGNPNPGGIIGGAGDASVTGGGHIFVQENLSVGGDGANGALTVNGGSIEVGDRMGVGFGGIAGTVALGGVGVVNIGAGGTIQIDAATITAGDAALYVGDFGGTQGSVNVDGAGALLNVGTQKISLGTLNSSITNSTTGQGSLSVTQGGAVTAGILNVGGVGIGSADVQSGGSAAVNQIDVAGGEIVGTSTYAGQGSLNIGAASTVTVAGVGLGGAAALAVGYYGGAVGQVNVTGAGALLNVLGTNQIALGTYNGTANSTSGSGGMTVSQGAVANATQIQVGYTGQGALTVNSGATVNVGGALSVGDGALVGTTGEAGAGLLDIGANGTVTVGGAGVTGAAVSAGNYLTATGAIWLGGAHAMLNAGTNTVSLGGVAGGDASLSVFAGGFVTAGTIDVGYAGSGALGMNVGGTAARMVDIGVLATGQGSVLLSGAATGLGISALTVGDQGLGRLAVTNSANLVVNGTAVLGNAAGGTGQVAVASGGHFYATSLVDGSAGAGALTVDGNALLDITNGLTVGATGGLFLQAGSVVAGSITNRAGLAGAGTLNTASLVNDGVVTAAGGELTITGSVTGSGVLAITGSGSPMVVNGVGNGQAVAFTAPGGLLQVNNFAAFDPSGIAGFTPSDQIDIVTDSATPSADSISDSFNATTDALSITVGATTESFQMTGTHTASDFANAVVGVDTVTAANQTISLGSGSHILFLGLGSTNDTIVAPTLPAPNFLDIFNFAATDMLDFRAALAGTTWSGSSTTLGNYLTIASAGSADVISLSQSGTGAGTPIVRLENTSLTFSQLVAHSIT